MTGQLCNSAFYLKVVIQKGRGWTGVTPCTAPEALVMAMEVNPFLFFPAETLTPSGAKCLRRLNGKRIVRFFGNLPHSAAFAVFRVWTNARGTGVGVYHASSEARQVRESYLIEGLRRALAKEHLKKDTDYPDAVFPLLRAKKK